MYVIPLKWMPYILIIFGCAGIISDDLFEDITVPIFMLIIGGVWLWLRGSSSSSSSTNQSSTTTASSQKSISTSTESTKTAISATTKNTENTNTTFSGSISDSTDPSSKNNAYCHCCGAKVSPASLFCDRCGTQIIT